MRRALGAALACFLLVYAAGFILGIVRVLAVAPRAGELAAVLIEAPFMLAASWLAAGWSIRRFGVPRAAGPRAVMGGAGFLLLMAAEFALAGLLFARPPRWPPAGPRRRARSASRRRSRSR